MSNSMYPTLVKVFGMISADNGGCTADEVEAALATLTDAELEVLAAGEHTEQQAICLKLGEGFDRHTVEAMNKLLEVAFDG